MSDPRQPSDCVCYDADGNVIRVIVARKRSSKTENTRKNLKALHALKQMRAGEAK